MQIDIEDTLLIRKENADVEEAYSEAEQRRRKARSAAVYVALEKEFGPANRLMARSEAALMMSLCEPREWWK